MLLQHRFYSSCPDICRKIINAAKSCRLLQHARKYFIDSYNGIYAAIKKHLVYCSIYFILLHM